MWRTNELGKRLQDDEAFVEDPSELTGKPFYFKVAIDIFQKIL